MEKEGDGFKASRLRLWIICGNLYLSKKGDTLLGIKIEVELQSDVVVIS